MDGQVSVAVDQDGEAGVLGLAIAQARRVQIAITGRWANQPNGPAGGANDKGNHAKVGVSLPSGHDGAAFGDMNQTGGLKSLCDRSHNPRRRSAVQDADLAGSIRDLLDGLMAADESTTVEEGVAAWTPSSPTGCPR